MLVRGSRASRLLSLMGTVSSLGLVAACGGQADARDAPVVKIAPQLQEAELGGAWSLVALPNVAVIPADQTPRIVFFPERIRGHTGCNTVAGPMALDGQSVRLGRLAVSRVGCPNAESQVVEGALLGALRSAQTFGMHGHQLVLVGSGRVELARFEASDR